MISSWSCVSTTQSEPDAPIGSSASPSAAVPKFEPVTVMSAPPTLGPDSGSITSIVGRVYEMLRVPSERGPEGKLAWQGESLSFVATLYESKSQTEGKSFSDKLWCQFRGQHDDTGFALGGRPAFSGLQTKLQIFFVQYEGLFANVNRDLAVVV